jgi:threonine aldolase
LLATFFQGLPWKLFYGNNSYIGILQQEGDKMYSFKNDYSEGAHPRILQALQETNLVQTEGYGEDQFTLEAITLLKGKLNRPGAAVHMFSGGTQTNLTAIAAFLRPHEAVISAQTGHIFVHETGAIEATGHKVVTVESQDGKLTPAMIQGALDFHTDEHMVKPRMVYISNTTEVGTIYTKTELTALWEFCQTRNLLLFMDGARLGSALTARGNDLTLADVAQLTDAFYIGGTKNGALLGEALVICKESLQEDFRFAMKQRGALLAKGRLVGLQFRELFRDDLFFSLAEHANRMAVILREAIIQEGYSFLTDSPSNQIFPILPNRGIKRLAENFAFYTWSKVGEDSSAIRLVTSWATQPQMVEAFAAQLQAAR